MAKSQLFEGCVLHIFYKLECLIYQLQYPLNNNIYDLTKGSNSNAKRMRFNGGKLPIVKFSYNNTQKYMLLQVLCNNI